MELTDKQGGMFEAIDVRVKTVERDVGDVKTQVTGMREAMATKADVTAIFARLENLSAQYAAARNPNYSLLVSIVATGLVFLTMIGGFAYWPINSATVDLKNAINSLNDKVVTQKQYDGDSTIARASLLALRSDINQIAGSTIQQQRYNLDAAKLDTTIAALRESVPTRHGFNDLAIRIKRLEDLAMSHKQ